MNGTFFSKLANTNNDMSICVLQSLRKQGEISFSNECNLKTVRLFLCSHVWHSQHFLMLLKSVNV